ncbi:CidA/LrgA family protein [Sinorhizobium meliloti]|nr:CidA/LrgA family protein [Sinorhizobium meliloti]
MYGLLSVLVCQLFGETLAYLIGVPIPGPVFGIVFFIALLAFWEKIGTVDAVASLTKPAELLLQNMSLLFVPAGVGIIQRSAVFSEYGFALVVTVFTSTIAALLATVSVFLATSRLVSGTLHRDRNDQH